MSLKHFAYRILNTSYEAIYKESISPQIAEFFISTSDVTIGALAGSLLGFAFLIVGARVLGPSNFGNYSLVLTLSTFLGISMSFGIAAMVKYGSQERDRSVQATILSTTYKLVLLSTTVSAIVFTILASGLSQLIGTSGAVFSLSIVFAVIFTFFSLTLNTLRPLFRLREFAFFNAAESAIYLVVFVVLIVGNAKTWESLVYSVLVANAVIGFILVIRLRRCITSQFDKFWAKRIYRFALFGTPASVAGVFMGLDIILVYRFMTVSDVGIYSAYFFSSMTLAILLMNTVATTFYPYASRSEDKKSIFLKLSRAAPYLVLTFIPAFVLSERIFFLFFGNQYPFRLDVSLLFAIAGTIFFFYGLLGYLLVSTGTWGVKSNSIGASVAPVVLVFLNVILIPLLGILGAAITLIFAYLIPTLYFLSKRNKLNEHFSQDAPDS